MRSQYLRKELVESVACIEQIETALGITPDTRTRVDVTSVINDYVASASANRTPDTPAAAIATTSTTTTTTTTTLHPASAGDGLGSDTDGGTTASVHRFCLRYF